MGIRETINQNQAAVIIIAGILILGAGAYIFWPRGPKGGGTIYYADIVTGRIYTGGVNLGSPHTSPDGNEAYRAEIYTCGECKDGDWFVAHYLRDTGDGGSEVSIDAKKWVGTTNPEFVQVVTERTTCPNEMVAAPCYPP